MKRWNEILNGSICSMMVVILATMSNASAANVVQRNTVSTANRVSAVRPTQAASRMPTMTVNLTNTATTTTNESEPVAETTNETTTETSVVENKSSLFGLTVSSTSTTEIDTSAATLAELIRAQRAALDAVDAAAVVNMATDNASGNGENICDTKLRECMVGRCGANFSKCIADTDTTFFDKMDTCRRTTNCTGREYQLFSAEIKADRDMNAKLANYNATVDCGNNYDTCIVAQCGATYSKCIGKAAGDTAIQKCENIAKSCTEYDSGLAMRTMAVFGELRQTAERQIATDEQKLYALREQMRSVCTRLGAMFDERSLDCVYTVNFYAGGDSTIYASKKAYAGNTFDCTQNWFGVDITTFRENAFRATRAQTSASSAMLGAGLGIATGALTSGAIDRAVDRYKADKDLDTEIRECMQTHGVDAVECRDSTGRWEKIAKQLRGTGTTNTSTQNTKTPTPTGNAVTSRNASSPLASVDESNVLTDVANTQLNNELAGVGSGVSQTQNPTTDQNETDTKVAPQTPQNSGQSPESTATAGQELPEECKQNKNWYPFQTDFANKGLGYLGKTIHQPETAPNYTDEINVVKKLCEHNKGTWASFTREVRRYKNICNKYNTAIEYTCDFKDEDPTGMRCKKIFYPKNNDDKVPGTKHIYASQSFSSDVLLDKEPKPTDYNACYFIYAEQR